MVSLIQWRAFKISKTEIVLRQFVKIFNRCLPAYFLTPLASPHVGWLHCPTRRPNARPQVGRRTSEFSDEPDEGLSHAADRLRGLAPALRPPLHVILGRGVCPPALLSLTEFIHWSYKRSGSPVRIPGPVPRTGGLLMKKNKTSSGPHRSGGQTMHTSQASCSGPAHRSHSKTRVQGPRNGRGTQEITRAGPHVHGGRLGDGLCKLCVAYICV